MGWLFAEEAFGVFYSPPEGDFVKFYSRHEWREGLVVD